MQVSDKARMTHCHVIQPNDTPVCSVCVWGGRSVSSSRTAHALRASAAPALSQRTAAPTSTRVAPARARLAAWQTSSHAYSRRCRYDSLHTAAGKDDPDQKRPGEKP